MSGGPQDKDTTARAEELSRARTDLERLERDYEAARDELEAIEASSIPIDPHMMPDEVFRHLRPALQGWPSKRWSQLARLASDEAKQ
jgi:hypothetical protein